MPRKEVIALLGSLFTGTEADPETDFWSWVASAICDLCPEELMDAVREAYDRGLISSQIIGLDSFEEALDRSSKSAAYQEIRQERKRYMPRHFHERMSGWAMHDEQETE